MEDRDDTMWDGLGSIDAFIASSATSPRATPSTTSSPSHSPWPWDRLPEPRMLQVRLHDGEPADPAAAVDGLSAAELDMLIPSLPIATGRVEKPLPHSLPADPSPLIAAPKPQLQPVIVAKSEPLLPTAPPLPKPQASPPRPTPLVKRQPVLSAQSSPVRVQGISRPVPLPARTFVAPGAVGPAKQLSPPSQSHSEASCSLKEKREREAKQFPKEILGNLDGTTSAEVRKMNATERELVLYKRKLRNRESARRSRQKRQATLAELQEEIDDLMQITGRMVEAGISLHEENVRLRERLGVAHAEIKGLKSVYTDPAGVTDPASPASVALKMKLGG